MDSFLDLARASFCRLSEEVHQLAADYRDAHDLPGLKVPETLPLETLSTLPLILIPSGR